MSKKNFKIKPKVWPKEYSFEEFKQLNPTINENLLINYYNKYLQEYAEDRSRHIKHFNGTKENLSKELNLLNEKLINNITDNPDRDSTVGPTGAGRLYHKALPADVKSVYFDGVDDALTVSEDHHPLPPGSSLRPYNALTVAAWVRHPGAYDDSSTPWYALFDCYQSGGYHLSLYHKSPWFTVAISDGEGARATTATASANYNSLGSDRVYGTPDDWHLIVGTYDCKAIDNGDGTYTAEAKLYVDGGLPTGRGPKSSPTYDVTKHTVPYSNSTGLGTSGSEGSIFYDGEDGTNPGWGNFTPGILTGVSVSYYTGLIDKVTTYDNSNTGSMANVAVWNAALSADAIYDLWYSVVSGSSGAQYDLTYEGHQSSYQYDINDEGLDYTNIGPYAKNLQLWYKLDEPNSSSIAIDSSGKGYYGTYYNYPLMSSSFAPGLKGF